MPDGSCGFLKQMGYFVYSAHSLYKARQKKITKWIFKNQYFVPAFAMLGLTGQMSGGEESGGDGICVCVRTGVSVKRWEKKSQVVIIKQLGGRQGKGKPKINLDFGTKTPKLH